MTHKEFFDWLRSKKSTGKLTQTDVDYANKLLQSMTPEELQKALGNIFEWSDVEFDIDNKMKISREGLDLIKKHEGVRLKAYKDPVGIITIGYGHTNLAGTPPKVTMGQTITRAEAEEILLRDIEKTVYPVIYTMVKVPLTQGQFDALCSFIFNLGGGNFGDSTLLELINKKDFGNAALQFKYWVKAGGKVLRGLQIRRSEERSLFQS